MAFPGEAAAAEAPNGQHGGLPRRRSVRVVEPGDPAAQVARRLSAESGATGGRRGPRQQRPSLKAAAPPQQPPAAAPAEPAAGLLRFAVETPAPPPPQPAPAAAAHASPAPPLRTPAAAAARAADSAVTPSPTVGNRPSPRSGVEAAALLPTHSPATAHSSTSDAGSGETLGAPRWLLAAPHPELPERATLQVVRLAAAGDSHPSATDVLLTVRRGEGYAPLRTEQPLRVREHGKRWWQLHPRCWPPGHPAAHTESCIPVTWKGQDTLRLISRSPNGVPAAAAGRRRGSGPRAASAAGAPVSQKRSYADAAQETRCGARSACLLHLLASGLAWTAWFMHNPDEWQCGRKRAAAFRPDISALDLPPALVDKLLAPPAEIAALAADCTQDDCPAGVPDEVHLWLLVSAAINTAALLAKAAAAFGGERFSGLPAFVAAAILATGALGWGAYGADLASNNSWSADVCGAAVVSAFILFGTAVIDVVWACLWAMRLRVLTRGRNWGEEKGEARNLPPPPPGAAPGPARPALRRQTVRGGAAALAAGAAAPAAPPPAESDGPGPTETVQTAPDAGEAEAAAAPC
eukprot:TRINITY_DN57376_c0_g1_i1.p1 TRINITY_DN57376_c0_g1~~TRINITY_DN57376_c0_g1_i1.p1  ORF type:complete len:578 (+),score=94.58 TRINITY_DN57376_c0_g1_i1:68-1801(+)